MAAEHNLAVILVGLVGALAFERVFNRLQSSD